jgi:alcohol dehydrogenase
MKAVQISKYGGYDVLEIISEVQTPAPANGQILVEVHAASINPFDGNLRQGFMKDNIPLKFPVTMGGDFAGTVVSIGRGVTGVVNGDEIYGTANILSGGTGSFAEYAIANFGNISQKPKSIDYIQAASLPLVGVSSIQALEDYIALQKGQKILIHGGAGGIGSIAIQLAKSIGAYVTTTVGKDSFEYVKKLGADEIIDYKNEKFENILHDFDAVYDTVGGETTNKSFVILKRGGVLVSMMGKPDEKLAEEYKVTVVGQGTKTDANHLKRLAELVDSGKIKPQVNKIFPFDEIQLAFKYQEEGHPHGKVVLQIK